jgi:Ca-activated chloride channel homolog
MSRHALHPTRARRRHPIRIVMATLLTLLVAGAAMIRLDATPSAIRTLAAKAPLVGAECPSTRLPATTVSVTVAPELQTTVRQALNPIQNVTLPDHECVRFTVNAQEPVETIQSAAILPLDRAPDIWIPDSSLWESRVPRWEMNQDGSFATSPVVLATSQKTVDSLGWKDKSPTWLTALSGSRPLAVPRISEDAAGLSAVIALWQSLDKGDAAQRALAGTVLAAGRADVPTEAQAIQAAESGSDKAPLLPTSQQAVAAANKINGRSALVAVQPTGETPSLDYPVLTMLRPGGTATEAAAIRARAVRATVAQLLNKRSAGIVEAAGFEVPNGRASATPSSADASPDDPATTPTSNSFVGLAPQELAGLVERITSLSAPSRFLTIFDLSGSMRGPAGNGQNRIDFAATSATLAGELLTDRAQVGLWGFSRDLPRKKGSATVRISKDIIKIQEIAPLGTDIGGGTGSHRDRLNVSMKDADKLLGGNGTALFSAAIAGMKEMKGQYDPRAGNAVVLFTDGENLDRGGPSLRETLDELGRLYDPKKPVRLICIGIGDEIDMKELRAMSSRAGGQAFLAKDPRQLPQVLFDVMNRR